MAKINQLEEVLSGKENVGLEMLEEKLLAPVKGSGTQRLQKCLESGAEAALKREKERSGLSVHRKKAKVHAFTGGVKLKAPIGSGLIEGAHRHVLQKHPKISSLTLNPDIVRNYPPKSLPKNYCVLP